MSNFNFNFNLCDVENNVENGMGKLESFFPGKKVDVEYYVKMNELCKKVNEVSDEISDMMPEDFYRYNYYIDEDENGKFKIKSYEHTIAYDDCPDDEADPVCVFEGGRYSELEDAINEWCGNDDDKNFCCRTALLGIIKAFAKKYDKKEGYFDELDYLTGILNFANTLVSGKEKLVVDDVAKAAHKNLRDLYFRTLFNYELEDSFLKEKFPNWPK